MDTHHLEAKDSRPGSSSHDSRPQPEKASSTPQPDTSSTDSPEEQSPSFAPNPLPASSLSGLGFASDPSPISGLSGLGACPTKNIRTTVQDLLSSLPGKPRDPDCGLGTP